MIALSRVARHRNYIQQFAAETCRRAPIAIHYTYAAINYVDTHLYGIWGLTKHGALCFNYWPEHLINDLPKHIINNWPQYLDSPGRRGETVEALDNDPYPGMDVLWGV